MRKKRLVVLIALVLLALLLLGGAIFYITRDGFEFSFKKDALPTDAEGNVYEVIEVGNQVWFAENIKTTGHSEGKSWCYDEEEENCEIYGRLYDWEAAMEVCPDGWVLPTHEDWQKLQEHIGERETIGSKLKSIDFWEVPEEEEEEYKSFEEYGLVMLPGGHYVDGYFYDLNLGGFWWTSTRQETGPAWSRSLLNRSNDMVVSLFGPEHAFSVRCLKESE